MPPQATPTVILVGHQDFANILAQSGASWHVYPAVPTVTALWTAIDAGTLPAAPSVVVITDGTGTAEDPLEPTLAEFAKYSLSCVVADQTRGPAIVHAAAAQPNAQQGTRVHHLPSWDLQATLDQLRMLTSAFVMWPGAAAAQPPTYNAPVTPAAPRPPVDVENAPIPSATADYEQGSVYSSSVAALASKRITKLPNAKPGQVTIACMSSKGGSGKSTTAISLAGMIAKASAAAGEPKRVVLVDLDTRDGQVGSLIGQYMPTAISIRVLPTWDAQTIQANLVHDRRLGIDALLAPIRPRNADDVGPDFYRQIIQVLQTTHDVVVLDCSVNYLDPLLGVGFALADEILFVTTLATTSVQGMARSLTELFADPADGGLGIPKSKVGVVANQVLNAVGMGKDKLLRAALGAPLIGQIPAEHDAVLIQTNSNRMDKLLEHPRLGPAYFALARMCVPKMKLAEFTPQLAAASAPATPMEHQGQPRPAGYGYPPPEVSESKRPGLFRRG